MWLTLAFALGAFIAGACIGYMLTQPGALRVKPPKKKMRKDQKN